MPTIQDIFEYVEHLRVTLREKDKLIASLQNTIETLNKATNKDK